MHIQGPPLFLDPCPSSRPRPRWERGRMMQRAMGQLWGQPCHPASVGTSPGLCPSPQPRGCSPCPGAGAALPKSRSAASRRVAGDAGRDPTNRPRRPGLLARMQPRGGRFVPRGGRFVPPGAVSQPQGCRGLLVAVSAPHISHPADPQPIQPLLSLHLTPARCCESMPSWRNKTHLSSF